MVQTATKQILCTTAWAALTWVLSGPVPVEAGAWTLPGGRAWTKISFFHQSTDEWYIDAPEPVLLEDGTFSTHPVGERRPYRFNGSYESQAIFLEGFLGITDWLDVGVQVPYFDQTFDDDTRTEPPSDAGWSDVRVFAKTRLLQNPMHLTVKLGAKMPTGDFRNEDGLIPVGEGQWDFDFFLQAGRSLWPLPAYANVDAGYRLRLRNDQIDRDPGDEWLINAEIGGQPYDGLSLALKYEMLRSGKGETFGIRTASLIKRISYLAPTIGVRLRGDTWIEGAMRSSFGGRNFPAGRQWVLGISTAFDVPRLRPQ